MSREFKDPESISEWKPVPGMPKGLWEIILHRDNESGTYSRLLRLDPEFPGSRETLRHDFDEVVYIINGGLIDSLTGKVYPAGTVAFFPEGLEHGPHTAPVGALLIEFRHFKSEIAKQSK